MFNNCHLSFLFTMYTLFIPYAVADTSYDGNFTVTQIMLTYHHDVLCFETPVPLETFDENLSIKSR